eukprot:CAMPEP_0180424112 /NCGR_PEP_ID=MMETSP1036_2-20121128/4570_1 /TAXON_ID=632150 /ORGANISM="Azadinium spinosum, Strain 3D9" /LENGTH=311 /DNA_ID=CAMNT_0022429541 /DNA_START=43 /DNA_END=975 /DNA_ORIENTATION=+
MPASSEEDRIHSAIRSAYPDATPQKKSVIQSLWAGYGKILRIKLSQCNVESVVVKQVKPPAQEAGRDIGHDRKVKSYQIEQRFYERYAPKLDPGVARVPRLLASSNEVPGETLFVLEDLDASGFEGRHGSAISVVRWLAGFHKTFLLPPGRGRSLDADGGEGVWNQGGYWHLATRPDELACLAEDDPLRIHAADFDGLLRGARYQTLLHGDPKMCNFCFSSTSCAGVDFQYTGWGPGILDLTYGFGLSLSSSDPLLNEYFRILDAGPELEAEWRALIPVAQADWQRFIEGWGGSGGDWRRRSNKFDEALKQ